MASRIETPQLVFQSNDSVMKNSSGKHLFTPVPASFQTICELVPQDIGLFPDGKIPAWATEFVVELSGVSISDASQVLLQVKTESGWVVSGYVGASSNSSTFTGQVFTAGIGILGGNANHIRHGRFNITQDTIDKRILVDGVFSLSDAGLTVQTAGSNYLGLDITGIRVTTSSGTAQFDAGTIGGYFR